MIDIRHPEVHIQLTGEDGNGFLIASRVRPALKKAGVSEEEREFWNEALSGDYSHLLQTVIKWCAVLPVRACGPAILSTRRDR
jgi:hypothetical protein